MLIVVDGHSIAYKIFYKTPPLYNSKKVPTSLIHSFLNLIISLKERYSDAKIIVVFDAKGETFRHNMFSQYKANRSKSPEDLTVQVEYLKKIIPALGFELYSKDGFEADDIIFTLAVNAKEDVFLVTKDKDLAQIVSEKIRILDYQTGEILDAEKVKEKYGVTPDQIVDFLALTGDSSDNIPGVKGVGEKTALSLIQEFGSLEGIYDNLDKLKSSVRLKLEEDKASAFLSRELVRLRAINDIDSAKVLSDVDVKEMFEELELRALMVRLFGNVTEKVLNYADVTEGKILFCIQKDLYLSDGKNYRKLGPLEDHKVDYYFNLKDILKLFDLKIDKGIDLEILSWLTDPDIGVLKMSESETIADFIHKVFSRYKRILHLMDELGLWELYWDLEYRVIFILAEMEKVGIKLDHNRLMEIDAKIKTLLESEKRLLSRMLGEEINLNSPKQLAYVLFDKLKMVPFKKNKTGFSTDEDSLKNMILLNPSYEELLKSLLRYREFSKLVSTYTSRLSDYVDPKTGRIHSQFKQTGTATGRLSSLNPNLQNIPKKGELGSDIRSAFVAEDGYSFLSVDYSQIELRILAHITEDEELVRAFYEDMDIHNITAERIFGLKDKEIDRDTRRIAKAVNFGIVYGLSPYGLARDVGISQSEAKIFIDKYFKTYPKVKKYMEDIVKVARDKGYVKTILNRPRFIPDIKSSNTTVRQRAERIAINSPIQGSAADIIKLAMIKTCDYLRNQSIDGRLVLQVHDELVFEINDKFIDKMFKDIKLIMENVCELKVPLKVNCTVAKNLGDV
ncbi:MAG: DNA polymerase [Calditerrivibrio sp.]|nr:DNA polymerase [Calditerrivibrio sp.]